MRLDIFLDSDQNSWTCNCAEKKSFNGVLVTQSNSTDEWKNKERIQGFYWSPLNFVKSYFPGQHLDILMGLKTETVWSPIKGAWWLFAIPDRLDRGSGVSTKVEPTVEFLPSDWLEGTQVTGFVLIQIFETLFFKRGRERDCPVKTVTVWFLFIYFFTMHCCVGFVPL